MSEQIIEPRRGDRVGTPCTNRALSQNRAADVLLRLVDAGLVGVIFLAPLFMAGRGDIGRLVYVAMVCLTTLCWAARQCLMPEARWRWTGTELVLLAGLLLVLLQLTPLPQSLLLMLSPKLADLLPLWTTQADPSTQWGAWSQLTLTPQATRGGLVMFVAHALLFLVVVQRIREVGDIHRLLRWLATAAIGMAVLGLAQMLLSSGKFLWVYEHPFRDTHGVVRGTFQNQNHFAHFLVLGIGPLIWWLQRLWIASPQGSFRTSGRTLDRQGTVRHVLTIGLGVVAVAVLLTFSRGGAIAMLVAALVAVGTLIQKGVLGKRAMLAVGGLALIVGAALMIYGYEPLTTRLSTLRDARSLAELCRGRNALWAAHAKAIPQFPITGAGVGSHAEIYPTYMEEDFDVEFTHGENGYLHLLVENGFAGLIVLLAALALAVYWSLGVIRRAPETEVTVVAAALLSGLAASIVHSFGDFVWYIPACLSLTAVIAACLCRLHQLSASETARQAVVGVTAGRVLRPLQLLIQPAEFPLPRLAWVAATVGLAGVAAMALANRIPPALAAPHWEAYFKLARAVRYSDAFDNDEVSPEQTAAMATHLAEALRRDPWHDRANLRMAAVCLRQFETQQLASENPMPLAQIRDAALASRFKSREAQDQWLALVMGENRRLLDKALAHARRALRLCPLHGDAYVYLAELAFLESPAPHLKQAYVAQATRVRPYSGVVLLAAGSEAAMAGDVTGALAMWTKAFHQDREQETQIIELLGPRIPASMFLEQFQPGRPALSKLYSFYHRNGRTEDARLVGTQLVAYLEREAAEKTGLEAAAVWDQASQIHEFLGDTQPATECARQAIHETPDVFPRHFRLATLLLKNHEYEEAVTELQWCVSRKPEDQGLKHQLELANRQRLAARSSIARH